MATAFPELMAGVGELYGTSSARVCEARAFAADLDALEREELALERTVQALVARKAPAPIGLKFHRMATPPPAPLATTSNAQPSRLCSGGGDARDDGEMDDEDEDDDMEEDEMDDEADDEVDDEEDEDDDDAFPLDSDDGDDSSDNDPFAHEGDVSMDLDGEEEEAAGAGAAAPRRETW